MGVRLIDRLALHPITTTIGSYRTAIHNYTARRTAHPWTAMVSVPLEMTATMTLLLWWTWPLLIICAWWWADRSWRWTWLIAVEAGVLGTQWAFLGSYAFVYWPTQQIIVGLCWAAYPAAIGAVSFWGRRNRDGVPSLNGY